MYRIIDAHTHIYPDKIAQKALRQIATFYRMDDRLAQPEEAGTVGYLLRLQEELGIERSLVCSAAYEPRLVPALNRFLTESCQAAGERFWGFCAIHAGCKDIPAILAQCQKDGLHGVKIHPDYQQFDMDDPRLDPLYAYCTAHHFPVLIHCGDDRLDHSSPARLQRVLDRFPRCPIIAAHLGGYRRWDESIMLRPSEGLCFDTSSALFALPRERVIAFFERFGYERFLFGSDYPLFDPREELRRFLALGLSEGQNRLILGENFLRLFGAGGQNPQPAPARIG